MTTRNLDHLLRPTSVAVIGASDRPASVGSLVLRNLRGAGFEGPIWVVNPKHATVGGQAAHADVDALPQTPDLAVICSPASTVPRVIEQLGARGTRAAIVLSAGLRASRGPDGRTLEQAMLDAARPHLLRILGPNCIGLLVPGIGLNASFAQSSGLPGRLAFLSQSGALATAMLDWGNARGIGFSHFVSLGDSADVDMADMLDYLADDEGTDAVLLYVESVKSARKFMSAARAAARSKPVLVVKAGRAPDGARAAASHTGALAAADDVVDAAIRRAGMLRVDTLTDLFDAAETLGRVRRPHGNRLAIVTNGGGAGVLAADAITATGACLATLDPQTLARLDAVLPATWSRGNPVDIIGDAPVDRYVSALEAVLDSPAVDTLLFMHAPSAIVPAREVAIACLPVLTSNRKAVLTSWLGGASIQAASEACRNAGLPVYETPERAVAALGHILDYQRNQALLMRAPPARTAQDTPDLDAARKIIRQAVAAGRHQLDEVAAKELLACCGIPVVKTCAVTDPDEAARAAERIGFPVALKILSPQLSHKSDVGGVVLNLGAAQDVKRAAEDMRVRVRRERPDAHLTGFTVQAMVRRPRAHELIVGIASDPVFGPVLMFGQGGTAVEVTRDRAIGLPPLDAVLASEMIAATRVARLLAGYRDRPAADMPGLVDAVLRVSQIACVLPEIAEMDINPLLVDEQGVIALDARISLHQDPAPVPPAIKPFPVELVESVTVDGRIFQLRPVRPEDADTLTGFRMQARCLLSESDPAGTKPGPVAARAYIDYDREIALLAFDERGHLVGEARARCDPDLLHARVSLFALPGRDATKTVEVLLERILSHLAGRGVIGVFAWPTADCAPSLVEVLRTRGP